jgi:hypothetical protein
MPDHSRLLVLTPPPPIRAIIGICSLPHIRNIRFHRYPSNLHVVLPLSTRPTSTWHFEMPNFPNVQGTFVQRRGKIFYKTNYFRVDVWEIIIFQSSLSAPQKSSIRIVIIRKIQLQDNLLSWSQHQPEEKSGCGKKAGPWRVFQNVLEVDPDIVALN